MRKSAMGVAPTASLFALTTSLFAPLAFGGSLAAQEQVPAEVREAITAVALDYIEGFYEGDAERMARSVHEDLAKRIAMPGPDGHRSLDHMGKATLVENTRRNPQPRDVDLRDRVKILDVYGAAAMVRVDADTWVDFLQLARLDDGWIIVNVLWELRPQGEGGD
jgi:hypothetical protein